MLDTTFLHESEPYSVWGGAKKSNPDSLSPVTSTNVEISHKNFLTFSFNPITTLV